MIAIFAPHRRITAAGPNGWAKGGRGLGELFRPLDAADDEVSIAGIPVPDSHPDERLAPDLHPLQLPGVSQWQGKTSSVSGVSGQGNLPAGMA